MKLENCGRCGLEPVTSEPTKSENQDGVITYTTNPWPRCPVHGTVSDADWSDDWNAAQFAARTKRINAAAVALMAGDWASDDCGTSPEQVVSASVMLIDAQDAAARVRWAEMQKGE